MGIEDKFNINIGKLKKGKRNLITDVDGVKVGHVTLDEGSIKTGVTAILPHKNNLFQDKVMASSTVINGFGKSIGLVQIEELGNIESPIVMTNTLSVGTGSTALIKYMLKENEDIGKTTSTINCTVVECNDGYLNDIRGLHIKEDHVFEALENADSEFEEGSVGAGTGMSCYQLKGGIGSSSRVIELDNKAYTVGALVLSNCGLKENLIVNGRNLGQEINFKDKCIEKNDRSVADRQITNINNIDEELEKGSIIIIIATDVPLSERQLKRISKRATISLGRTGSYLGNGSGDICIAFTTANKIKHYEKEDLIYIKVINENKIDLVFRAVVESVEESIISSMIHSKDTIGRDDNKRESILNYLGGQI
ncbi:S58 family peptidase [Romboutsia weinsteinii]|uniref:S58 family peptidase n=1 Tax=Romboutsia weinsteinii TaxID=2020949 RepID=A0A371J2X5_9FIRM|nr:P1 family peptidase [Romboutsia weinsteinii]RDY27018.1 S58 family peptidase [Romboutsia weinsteinii]